VSEVFVETLGEEFREVSDDLLCYLVKAFCGLFVVTLEASSDIFVVVVADERSETLSELAIVVLGLEISSDGNFCH